MPTLYKNLWTVTFSHCQTLNLPFKKFVICNLSSSQKFVNCNFHFNKLVNCNFSFTTLSGIHKQNILLLLLSLLISNIWTSILHFALIIIKNYHVIDSISLIGQIECNQFAKNGRVVYAVKSHHQCNQAGPPRWPWMI